MGCAYAAPETIISTAAPETAIGTAAHETAITAEPEKTITAAPESALTTMRLPPDTVQVLLASVAQGPSWHFMQAAFTLPAPVERPFETGRALASWFVEHAARVSRVPGTCAAVWHSLDGHRIIIVARFIKTDWSLHEKPLFDVACLLRDATFPRHSAPLPLAVVLSGLTAEQHRAGVAQAKAQADADVAALADYGWVQRPIASRCCLVGNWSRNVPSAAFVVRLAMLEKPRGIEAQHALHWVKTAFEANAASTCRHGAWKFGQLVGHPSPHFVTIMASFSAFCKDVPSDPCFVGGAVELPSSGPLSRVMLKVGSPAALATVIIACVSPVSEAYLDRLFELQRQDL